MNKVGVSQKAIILNSEGKLLAIRRSNTAPTGPLRWDLPGGDLDFGEDPIHGILREIEEETGLVVDDPVVFDVASRVDPDGNFWVTPAYKVHYQSGDVRLSYEHDQFKWVTPEEFLELESSEKLQRFVKKLLFVRQNGDDKQ